MKSLVGSSCTKIDYSTLVSVMEKDKFPSERENLAVHFTPIEYDGYIRNKPSMGSAPPAPDPVLKKLDELAALPYGWEYGKGRPTLPAIHEVACALYRGLAHYHLEADAFPCADGSLYLVFYAGALSVQVEFWSDGTIDVTTEAGYGDEIKELASPENVSLTYARNLVVQTLVQESASWQPSGSFTHGITIGGKAISAAHVLHHQVMAPAYQLSTPLVCHKQPHQFVNISLDTIPALQTEDLSFIGGFLSINSPTPLGAASR